MRDVTGDLWSYQADVRAVTTNGFIRGDGRAVMGRGCAREARDKFGGLDHWLGTQIKRHGNRCFRLAMDGDWTLLTFPVKPDRGADGKPGWMCKAELPLIERSATQAVEMADKFGWKTICLPRPGCGNGELEYDDVREVLAGVLDDRFHVITFG